MANYISFAVTTRANTMLQQGSGSRRDARLLSEPGFQDCRILLFVIPAQANTNLHLVKGVARLTVSGDDKWSA
jgi:hypothetical protein